MAYKNDRVLASMVALGTFTMSDLQQHSGVGIATVRTTVHRFPQYTQKVGQVPTGRRGGAPVRYALVEACKPEIMNHLRRVPTAVDLAIETRPPAASVPDELIIAEDLLLTRILRATDSSSREHVITSARIQLQSLRELGYYNIADTAIGARVGGVEWLLALAVGEDDEKLADDLRTQFVETVWPDLTRFSLGYVLTSQYVLRVKESSCFTTTEIWELFRPARPDGVFIVQERATHDEVASSADAIAQYLANRKLTYARAVLNRNDAVSVDDYLGESTCYLLMLSDATSQMNDASSLKPIFRDFQRYLEHKPEADAVVVTDSSPAWAVGSMARQFNFRLVEMPAKPLAGLGDTLFDSSTVLKTFVRAGRASPVMGSG